MKENKVIICVDDEHIVLTSLASVLHRNLGKSFEFEFVRSGQEALELLNELNAEMLVAVVISDWMMPDMLGDQLLSLIKSTYPKIKTIILSGQIDHEAKQRAINGKVVDHFIAKPWDEEELLDCILS